MPYWHGNYSEFADIFHLVQVLLQLFFHSDKCSMCKRCAHVCVQQVHQFSNGKHNIIFESCKLCGKCLEVCNTNALKITGTLMSVDEVMQVVKADYDYKRYSTGKQHKRLVVKGLLRDTPVILFD